MLLIYRSNYQNGFVKHIETAENAGLGTEKSGSEPGWEDKMLSGEFHRLCSDVVSTDPDQKWQNRYQPWKPDLLVLLSNSQWVFADNWKVDSECHDLSCQPAWAAGESWQHIRNSNLLHYNYLWLFSTNIQLNISVMAYHNILCDNIPTV